VIVLQRVWEEQFVRRETAEFPSLVNRKWCPASGIAFPSVHVDEDEHYETFRRSRI
jgi:hypothetical protein